MNAPYSDQLTLVDTGSEVFNIQSEALMNAPYSDQLTLVDTGSEVFNIQKIQAMPFARVYAPANLLDDTIADIRERLAHLFATLEGLQVIRVDTRKNAP